MIAAALDVLLAAAILSAAAAAVLARQMLTAVAMFVSYGLLLALAWVRLGAVDVALAEAAIGAGLSGVLLLGAAVRLAGGPRPAAAPAIGRGLHAAVALGCAAVAAGVATALLTLPDPAPSLAGAAQASLPRLEVGNPVTGVLMGFRALDTLLEAVVLVLALIAVWSLAPDDAWGGLAGPRHPAQREGPLALLARLLPPFGIVVGVHVVWVGADAPGGKFQGGTILAAMWLLVWMAGLVQPPRLASTPLRVAIVAGPVAFLLIGFAGIPLSGAFLSYPDGFAKPLIKLIEAAMTVSVAVGLALLVAGPPRGRA